MNDSNLPSTPVNDPRPDHPLHGVTLEAVLTRLVEQYGWAGLGSRINIRCFTTNPSIKSSLTFLRRTPWARKAVEELYVRSQLNQGS
jgi:uncharacterized protein (DUF2132 family)